MNKEEEIQKCKDDPVYFYENYFLINGEKPPKLNDYQKATLRNFAEGHCVYVFGQRQGGQTLFKKVVTSHLPDFIKPKIEDL